MTEKRFGHIGYSRRGYFTDRKLRLSKVYSDGRKFRAHTFEGVISVTDRKLRLAVTEEHLDLIALNIASAFLSFSCYLMKSAVLSFKILQDLRHWSILTSFKAKLKTFLFSQYFRPS